MFDRNETRRPAVAPETREALLQFLLTSDELEAIDRVRASRSDVATIEDLGRATDHEETETTRFYLQVTSHLRAILDRPIAYLPTRGLGIDDDEGHDGVLLFRPDDDGLRGYNIPIVANLQDDDRNSGPGEAARRWAEIIIWAERKRERTSE